MSPGEVSAGATGEAPRRRRGRPRKPEVPAEQRPVKRGVRLPPDVDDVYCRRALRSGKPIQQVMNEALIEHAKQERGA